MANRNVELCDILYQMLKYTPEWKNRNHLIIRSNETVELETGKENEVIAEYTVNRASLKKAVLSKL